MMVMTIARIVFDVVKDEDALLLVGNDGNLQKQKGMETNKS